MLPIVIFGASGHARVVADAVRSGGVARVVGLIDSFHPVGPTTFGPSVLGDEHTLAKLYRQGDVAGVTIAVGDNTVRRRLTERIAEVCPGLPFFSVVHRTATVAPDVDLGPGSVVLAGAVVNPGSRLGMGCIINTRASLDHDSTMGDFASLAPGVTTGGNCTIGESTAVGIGATLVHGVSVGAHTVVGAGAVVMRPLPAEVVAYGVPARVIRDRAPGDKYL